MAKVGPIIAAALRKLRVIDPDSNPEPRQYETAMEELNRLGARWEADGLALGWVAVDNPDDDLPAPVEAERAVILALAVALRGEYGATLDPDLAADAASAMSALWADITIKTDSRLSYELPAGSGCWGSRCD